MPDKWITSNGRHILLGPNGEIKGGPYTQTNHLESPISVAAMVRDIYGFKDLQWSGDVPTRGPGYDIEV